MEDDFLTMDPELSLLMKDIGEACEYEYSFEEDDDSDTTIRRRISINDRTMPTLFDLWDHLLNSWTIDEGADEKEEVIKSLVIQNAGFYGQQDCRSLARHASKLRKLRSMTIQDSKLGPRGIKILVEELLLSKDSNNSCILHNLDLATCRMGHFGAQSLAKFMPRASTTLHKLNIQSNNLGDDGIWKLASALSCLVNLKQLNLSDNQISDTGLCELGKQCLPTMIKLRKLILKGNQIKGITFDSFVSALGAESCGIHKLDLSQNQIGSSVVTEDPLSSTLGSSIIRTNRGALHVLDLSHNLLGDEGAVSIAESLDKNDHLQLKQVLLKDNHIGDMGAGAFVDALDVSTHSSSSRNENKAIVVLNLDDNPDISAARMKILDVLQKHRQQTPSTSNGTTTEGGTSKSVVGEDGNSMLSNGNGKDEGEEAGTHGGEGEILWLRNEVLHLQKRVDEMDLKMEAIESKHNQERMDLLEMIHGLKRDQQRLLSSRHIGQPISP